MRLSVLLFATATSACHHPTSETPEAPDAAMADVPIDTLTPLTTCPTSGAGAVVPAAGGECFTITPAETGADSAGENATVPSYALTAAGGVTPRGTLLLFINGSGGHPSGPIADPSVNFYNVAAALGYDVLAISYYSDTAIATQCSDDPCFLPTRESIILGVREPGASADVQAMTLDQGIADRVVLALRYLDAHDPGHRWASYLTTGGASPESQIAWNHLVVSGHSQGGGHAALIGKLFAVQRVIQLSATCDGAGGAPASWTSGTTGSWATDPTQFYGLAAATTFTNGRPSGGDLVCPYHAANWRNLGMVALHQDDNEATCGATTSVELHGASVKCADNADVWRAALR